MLIRVKEEYEGSSLGERMEVTPPTGSQIAEGRANVEQEVGAAGQSGLGHPNLYAEITACGKYSWKGLSHTSLHFFIIITY